MAFVASVEGNADQTLDGCADGSHGVELLIDRVGRLTVALKQIAVETAEVAVDPFLVLDLLDAIDRSSLAFVEQLRLLLAFDLLHFTHQVVAQGRQVSGRACRHAARYRAAVDHDDRSAAPAQLIGRRQAGDSTADHGYVALSVSWQGNSLRRHGD
jgi:hypothetical protein